MKHRSATRRQGGFTLVEIAIVLMIIGLLIGGILRGQELIQSARVRNLIDQKSAVQTAYIGFLDRYRMQAGDLTNAQATVVGNSARESTNAEAGNGGIAIANESTLFFQNLAAAGFISCNACMTVAVGGAAPATTNSPLNVYGDFLSIGHLPSIDTGATAATWIDPTASIVRLVLLTGGTTPSQVLAEMDRKADDGRPGTGQLRFTPGYTTSATSVATYCVPALTSGVVAAVWANPSQGNCQGAWLF